MSTDAKPCHPEIDAEVRKTLGKDTPSTSFDYHLLRLFLLIQRTVKDEELVHEMLEELRLIVNDLHERIQRL